MESVYFCTLLPIQHHLPFSASKLCFLGVVVSMSQKLLAECSNELQYVRGYDLLQTFQDSAADVYSNSLSVR